MSEKKDCSLHAHRLSSLAGLGVLLGTGCVVTAAVYHSWAHWAANSGPVTYSYNETVAFSKAVAGFGTFSGLVFFLEGCYGIITIDFNRRMDYSKLIKVRKCGLVLTFFAFAFAFILMILAVADVIRVHNNIEESAQGKPLGLAAVLIGLSVLEFALTGAELGLYLHIIVRPDGDEVAPLTEGTEGQPSGSDPTQQRPETTRSQVRQTHNANMLSVKCPQPGTEMFFSALPGLNQVTVSIPNSKK